MDKTYDRRSGCGGGEKENGKYSRRKHNPRDISAGLCRVAGRCSVQFSQWVFLDQQNQHRGPTVQLIYLFAAQENLFFGSNQREAAGLARS